MSRRHAIITCCDARFGDFLLDHWLTSLQANVDLTGVDVVVLDYGLSELQRATLSQRRVRCFPCVKDGIVCNLRYRDMCRLFDATDYDQVLSVDSGDVIFQADVRHLFEFEPDKFRAVPEQLRIPFHELLIRRSDVRPDVCRTILEYLEDKPVINAGVVWGPARGFRQFSQMFRETCHDFQCFGVDQMILNYVLHRDGFVPLEHRYNFVLISNASPYSIRDGVFLDRRGDVIPIVHNAGNKPSTRVIYNFGYGPERNERKWLLPIGVRLLILWAGILKLVRRPFLPLQHLVSRFASGESRRLHHSARNQGNLNAGN